MSSLTALAIWNPVCQAQEAPKVGNEMQEKASGRTMTEVQQAKLMQFVRVGLQWVAGKIPFDEVERTFGKPKKYEADGVRMVDYAYYVGDDVITVEFFYDKLSPINGKPRLDGFELKVKEGVNTNIPYETWDGLGLARAKRGALIDGVRADQGDFFDPTGLRDITGWDPKNYVTFSYRLPMPPDSPFDVGAGFGYLGEWISEQGGATLSNFRNAVNLRDLGVGRHYLTPDELHERELAKRQKYGEMNLRTGMPCPETGVWQGFAGNCTPDVTVVWKGQRFPSVRTLTHLEEREQRRPTNWVDGQWMWLREVDDSNSRMIDKGI
ncbi:hypothetical protein [Burkholderia ubonensis]|uniref:hypothetical protein n=1 Tax=Burkholderia ubonensis TaxID=101571 RepID=UPI0012FAEC04|nr:hypothetical protein [Burkholderia ubonensis]